MGKVNEVINTTEINAVAAVEAPVNLDASTVIVYLASPQMGEGSSVFVGLNGKGYQVPRGKPYPVPRPLFDVLRRSQDARNVTQQYIAGLEKRANDPALK